MPSTVGAEIRSPECAAAWGNSDLDCQRRKDPKLKLVLPLDTLEDRMNHQARHYGRMIGVKHAEGFIIKEMMRVDDVVRMPVRSI
jgi:hypothetical protein